MMLAVGHFLFNTRLGQMTAAIALAAALFGSWLLKHDSKVAAKTEAKIVATSEKAGREANAKASKAHARAAKPGAAQRLLKSSCRDCD